MSMPKRTRNGEDDATHERRKRKKKSAAPLSEKGANDADGSTLENAEGQKLEKIHIDGGVPAKPAPPPTGMQIYWNLASTEARTREVAAEALVKELKADQESYDAGFREGNEARTLLSSPKEKGDPEVAMDGCSPGVQYAVRRLIRGLASSREGARQGFALALATVLANISNVGGRSVMAIIEKSLEVSAGMKGQDARDVYFGRIFGYGAIIKAGRPIGSAESADQAALARDVTEELLDVASKKTFLPEAVVHVLLDLASRLPAGKLAQTVCASPRFTDLLKSDPEEASPEALLLALRLWSKLPKSVVASCQLLPATGGPSAIFTRANLARLAPALKASTHSHPRIHGVWHVLLELLFQPEAVEDRAGGEAGKENKKSEVAAVDGDGGLSLDVELSALWSVVVDGAMIPSSQDRRHLALELLQLLLPKLQAAHVAVLLSGPIMRCLLDNLRPTSAKDAPEAVLHKSAQRCLSRLVAWAEQGETQRRIAVMAALQKQSGGGFDRLTKTTTIKRLSASLDEEGCLQYVASLRQVFLQGETESSGSEAGAEGDGKTGVDVEDEAEGSDEDEDDEDEEGAGGAKKKEGGARRIWALDQMCAVCRQTQLGQDVRSRLRLEVMRFLLVHAAYEVREPKEGEELAFKELEGIPAGGPLPSSVREACKLRFLALLADSQHVEAAKHHRPGGGQKGEAADAQTDQAQKKKQKGSAAELAAQPGTDKLKEQGEDSVLTIARFCESVGRSPLATPVADGGDEEKHSLKALRATVRRFSSLLRTGGGEVEGEKGSRVRAMRALFLILQLMSVFEPQSFAQTSSELVTCCRNAFPELPGGQEKEEEEEGAPAYIDVLIDILLALLAEPVAPIKIAAEQVFRTFCGEMTPTALGDLLRVVRRQPGSKRRRRGAKGGAGKRADSDEEDDEDDDILEDDEEADEEDEGKEEEDEEEEEEEDEDEEDETEANGVAKEERKAGAAHESSDDEEQEDDDMDDEAMFRMDVHLANILKQRTAGLTGTKSGKDAKKSQVALLHFKFRVLVLLEIFLHKHPANPLVISAVIPLLQALASAYGPGGSAELAKKIGTLIKKELCKSHKYPRIPDADLEAVRKMLQKTLQLTSRSANKDVASAAAACAHFLTKVLHSVEAASQSAEDPEVVALYAQTLDDFFKRKRCHVSRPFFTEAFARHPWIARGLLGTLIPRARDARTPYLRLESLQLLAAVMRSKGPNQPASAGTNKRGLEKTLKAHVAVLAEALAAAVPSSAWKKPMQHAEALKCCNAVVEGVQGALGASASGHLKALRVAVKGGLREVEQGGKAGKIKVQLEKLKSALGGGETAATGTQGQAAQKEKAVKTDAGEKNEGEGRKKKRKKDKESGRVADVNEGAEGRENGEELEAGKKHAVREEKGEKEQSSDRKKRKKKEKERK